MIKIGSRVKFLQGTESGVVRAIKGNMAEVEVDGFEIPVLITEIVEVPIEQENEAIVMIGPDDPKPTKRPDGEPRQRAAVRGGQQYGRVTIEDDFEDEEVTIDMVRIRQQYIEKMSGKAIKAQAEAEAKRVVEPAPFELTDYAVKLAFVPVTSGSKPETLDLNAYIVNDSSYELFYTVGIWRHGYVESLKTGKLGADTKDLIKLFPRTAFSQIQTLHISLSPYKVTTYVPQPVENFDIELHPLKFIRSGNYAENDYFDQRAFIITLADSAAEQPQTRPVLSTQATIGDQLEKGLKQLEKESLRADRNNSEHKQTKVKGAGEPQVEDLHIEAILDSWEQLSPGEVLQAQVDRFTFVLDTAIKAKQQGRIVFIHGVGKGKLKYELKKLLDGRYPKVRYQDASFAEYGYGAIMVYLS